LLSIYEQIFLPNQENLFTIDTRENCSIYLWEFFDTDAKPRNEYCTSFSQWRKVQQCFIFWIVQEILLKIFSDELITPFWSRQWEVSRDVARWVHNTGRYYNWSSDVRFDTVPEIITQKMLLLLKYSKKQMICSKASTNMSTRVCRWFTIVSRIQKLQIEYYQQGGKVARDTWAVLMTLLWNYFYGSKASAIRCSDVACSVVHLLVLRMLELNSTI
jgi:hypothetical protein